MSHHDEKCDTTLIAVPDLSLAGGVPVPFAATVTLDTSVGTDYAGTVNVLNINGVAAATSFGLTGTQQGISAYIQSGPTLPINAFNAVRTLITADPRQIPVLHNIPAASLPASQIVGPVTVGFGADTDPAGVVTSIQGTLYLFDDGTGYIQVYQDIPVGNQVVIQSAFTANYNV